MESQVSITISEARDKHRQLQENIALLMPGFTRETGLLVESVVFNLSESADYSREAWYILDRDGHGNFVTDQTANPYENWMVKIKLKSPFDGVNA